jgi:hypothetical protein
MWPIAEKVAMDKLVHSGEASFPIRPYCLMQTNGHDKSRTRRSADHNAGIEREKGFEPGYLPMTLRTKSDRVIEITSKSGLG